MVLMLQRLDFLDKYAVFNIMEVLLVQCTLWFDIMRVKLSKGTCLLLCYIEAVVMLLLFNSYPIRMEPTVD